MATITLYPFSDGGDGTIYASSTSSWNAARGAASGTLRTQRVQSTFLTPTRFIERGFFTFDTSSIPDGATIVSATFSLYGNATETVVTNSPSWRIYSSTHTDTIDGTDYDLVGSTEYSNTYLTSPTTGAYNDFPFNASGLAAINKTGYTKFAIREATYDVANVQPGGANVFQFYDSEDSGTSRDPKLVIVYSDDFSMSFAQGAYTYTGYTLNLLKSLIMNITQASYTYTGYAIGLLRGFGIVFANGTYTYTGYAINFLKTLTMAIAYATYTYTGYTLTLTKGFNMLIETGTYVYTGFRFFLKRLGWRETTKNTSTWSDQGKASTTWQNQDKSAM